MTIELYFIYMLAGLLALILLLTLISLGDYLAEVLHTKKKVREFERYLKEDHPNGERYLSNRTSPREDAGSSDHLGGHR